MRRVILKRKSQIGMFETISVLLVFFVLLVFGMIFYGYYSSQKAKEAQSENDELLSIGLAMKIAHFPELKCTKGDITIENCFDLLKLKAFEESVINNKQYYFNIFSYSHITAEELYPGNQSYNIYSNAASADIAGLTTWVPISFYNPINRTHSVGYLKVVYIPFTK